MSLPKNKYRPLSSGSIEFPSRVRLKSYYGYPAVEIPGEDELAFLGESEIRQHFEEKSPITYWRRADQNDIADVVTLIEKSEHCTDLLFNQQNVEELIEMSSFSLLQFNANDQLVSFTSVFPYPNIPAVPSFEWFLWFENKYKIEDATPRNTYFIHYMIWDSDYYRNFLKLALETIFMEHPFLVNIVVTRPPLVKIPDIFTDYFIQVLPKDAKNYNCDPKSLQLTLLCLRHTLIERLKIRLAIVEDHDDLMPIIESQTSRLREIYGDFCMAELIEYPGTEDRKTLVCESMGYVVGVMSLNKSIDLELLNTQFDLGVFHGLRKPDERDKAGEILEDDVQKEIFIPDKLDTSLDIVNSDTVIQLLNWKPSLCASKEDFPSKESTSSEDSGEDENDLLSRSMINLIKQSLHVKIMPKFSAYVLSTSDMSIPSEISGSGIFVKSAQSISGESYVKSELSQLSLQHFNLPEYHGPSNAFCIELYAMHEDIDERAGMDFIVAAFEVFPDLDYCTITVPSQCPCFPLLDHFVRVTPRPLKRFKQELYVCHRSSILSGYMRVRRIDKYDLQEVYTLLNGLTKQELLYADIVDSCIYEDSAYQCFALVCDKSIVGVAVLCNENGMEYLAHHFHVSDLINFQLHKMEYHAILKHLALSPIYQNHARFFLRDIMRMADVTSLYRARYEELQCNWRGSIITTLGQFVPVKPRRMVKYNELALGENVPPPYFLKFDIPFALYHINTRICGIKKFTSNIHLVVVGASRTAFAFLEHLLFAPSSAYVTYMNITWVSPHGTGTEMISHQVRDLMFPYRGKYDRRYQVQLNLQTYVNVVYGVMTEINRAEKCIVINNDAILRYDYLLLLCAKQFLMPKPLVQILDSEKCQRKNRPRCFLFKFLVNQKPNEKEEKPSVYPPNVFLINTAVDANNAIVTLQYLMMKRNNCETDEKIIIYGHNINAYLCIQALLKFGIPSEMIVFVEPFPNGVDSVTYFRDPNVDKAIVNTLKELNIEHYRGYVLYDWDLCKNNQIESATFHAKHRKVTISCLAMFPYEKRLVSDVTFKAVNEASLVYDGKLVVNHNFRTNDPYIYGAGSFTKYQRKYFAKDKSHQYYSSDEVGELLANIIRNKIDPTMEPEPEKPSLTVPEMKRAIVISGQLPGDWNYFHLRNPGKIVSLETAYNMKEYGDTLTTGDCQMSKGYGYFRLHLDEYGFVQTITCYTKDEIDLDNLTALYGIHEKFLNDLLLRFDLGLIPDFYSYFREPWVYALYHDRFHLLMEENQEAFDGEQVAENDEKIVDEVVNALIANNWKRLSSEKMEELKEKFGDSDLKTKIQENLLDFLLYFDEPFPMYATSRIVRVLLHGATVSLLHKPPMEDQEQLPFYKPAIKISESVTKL